MRVVIAEDSVLLREGLERLLRESGLDVVGSCETAEDLLLKVRSFSPDVAIQSTLTGRRVLTIQASSD